MTDYIQTDSFLLPIKNGPGQGNVYEVGDSIKKNGVLPDGIYHEELGVFVVFGGKVVACFPKSSAMTSAPLIKSLAEADYLQRISKPSVKAVFAGVETSEGIGIGLDNLLPWPFIKEDMDTFKSLTSCKTSLYSHLFPPSYKRNSLEHREPCVIMGYKTWESLPDKYKPLPGRLNIILTTKAKSAVLDSIPSHKRDRVLVLNSFEEVVRYLMKTDSLENKEFFLIGGKSLYEQFLKNGFISEVFYTQITPPKSLTLSFDTYLDPKLLAGFRSVPVKYLESDGWGLNFSVLLP
jgi:dihydrofolate reductase